MTVNARVQVLDWDDLTSQLDERGFAVTAPLLTDTETAELAGLFDGGHFRSTIDMARHRFGDGRYRYFERPLPDTIEALRGAFYERLGRSPTPGPSGSAATPSRSAMTS